MDKNWILRCGVVQMLSIKVPLEEALNFDGGFFSQNINKIYI